MKKDISLNLETQESAVWRIEKRDTGRFRSILLYSENREKFKRAEK